ncbi:Mss4-like protein [Biscogniauxia marginata]|nr:Mss4-like protein [Biscogniauxia marginata]
MPTGSCFCGNIRISYEGEPSVQALCYCIDCRKVTGSTYSTNLIVPDAEFRVLAGTPKRIAKIADSGHEIASHFCPDCGTTLWREGPAFPGSKIVKAGVLDDENALGELNPTVELFVSRRPGWVAGPSSTTKKSDKA